jgi:hypothetical protein
MSIVSLSDRLREVCAEQGVGLGELTVLSAGVDPFRLDTPKNRRLGEWLAAQMERAGLLSTAASIHNRGIHYAIVSLGDVLLPTGEPYRNDVACWTILEDASAAARWLGYIPFDKIEDARNTEPVLREYAGTPVHPEPKILCGPVPELEEIGIYLPEVDLVGFAAHQQYRLVFWGEKTSLESVLKPLSNEYEADLYLPSGEVSNSQLHTMAKVGSDDGREMVVFVFADCDPAGYQMAVSIGHKLRAFKEALYPSLKFRVVCPALTVEQVAELGLPSTPLKETERRADGWRARYGIEQTEIDALATLRPDVLRQIVHHAVAPYFDATLQERVNEVRYHWRMAAQQALEDRLAIDRGRLAALYADAERALLPLREALQEIEARIGDLELPSIVVPDPEIGSPPPPFVSSDMPLSTAIETLRARKNYRAA